MTNDQNVEPPAGSGIDFPELFQGALEPQALERLIADIKVCTQILEVIPKYASTGYVDDSEKVDIDDAVQALVEGKLRGLQLRYLYEGDQWWDTLIRLPQGVKLVRVKHDF
ncbi:hypothetical protein [Rubritalea marina]|uniref:hypothetical protein n=1 Tax=Rubritalea marina TaxID=361055 RepID=UPI0003716DFA|nr:hypothetical protein [Rubritalea marina]